MAVITADMTKKTGAIRPMHATNNGPAFGPEGKRSNFNTFAAAGIPFVRNHDASLSEAYGSQHVVDVHCIFPDSSRDPDDPAAYDFVLTDVYTANILATGAKVFYRLGASIEHWKQKYGTKKPEDSLKWARICEHIIRHYNEGWADGFTYDITYWEIWNEPDLYPTASPTNTTWSGSKEEFFDFYCVASSHLKTCFPHLKIGGPAIAGNLGWAKEFLLYVKENRLPLDFFSWHIYCSHPDVYLAREQAVCALLAECGFAGLESICNEWNYVENWGEPLDYIGVIKGMKGAAFSAAVMCSAQNSGLTDMLMYYDARIEKAWNGMFSSDTLLPLKGYYPFVMFNALYRIGTQTALTSDDPDIRACAASDDTDAALMAVYYTNDAAAAPKPLTIRLPHSRWAVSLLDDSHDMACVGVYETGDVTLTMEANTVVFLQKVSA